MVGPRLDEVIQMLRYQWLVGPLRNSALAMVGMTRQENQPSYRCFAQRLTNLLMGGQGIPNDPNGENQRKKSGRKPLEIDRSGCQERLDAHVCKSAPHCACKPVPSFSFAVESFRAPAMALIETVLLFCPALATSTRTQQRRIFVDNYNPLRDSSGG